MLKSEDQSIEIPYLIGGKAASQLIFPGKFIGT